MRAGDSSSNVRVCCCSCAPDRCRTNAAYGAEHSSATSIKAAIGYQRSPKTLVCPFFGTTSGPEKCAIEPRMTASSGRRWPPIKIAKPGDRVWVLKQGRGPKGIFGAGEITGAPGRGQAGDGKITSRQISPASSTMQTEVSFTDTSSSA